MTIPNGITVCKECTDREIGCHATCERYIKQREEFEKTKEEIRQEKIKQKTVDEVVFGKRRKKRRW